MKALENKRNITKTLGFKVFLIFLLVLVLNIAASTVESVIYERRSYQREATESIIEPIGGAFRLQMVAISLPYHYYIKDNDGKQERVKDYAIIMPNIYKVDVHTKSNILNRGIFKTPVYTADVEIIGSFNKFDPPQVDYTVEYLFDEAVLLISTRNKQNFLSMPKARVGEKTLTETKLSLGDSGSATRNSFVFDIDKDMLVDGFTFNANLDIQGGESINILPVAGDNTITMNGDWADPSFSGNWLPVDRSVNNEGFAATWQIPSFNTPYSSSFNLGGSFSSGDAAFIRTNFLLLNDTYQKSMRSIKYSLLFICVPFFALFLCEMLTRKKVHVVQYALIGLANVIFYLLLLSISEHTNFNLSYFISSVMVITASSLYVAALTKMKKLGIVIAVVESIIYTFLFGILQLTDYALLVGSIGLFIALCAAMYFTRNITLYLEENEEFKF